MGKNYNLVVDTNVFLQGLNNFDYYAVKVVDLIEYHKVNLVFSGDTFGELIFMIKCWTRKNIKLKRDRLNMLYDFVDLFYNSLSYNTTDIVCPEIKDKFDNKFLECAIASNCDFLVTNDYKSGMHKVNGCNFKITDAKRFIEFYNGEQKQDEIAQG